ncbi:hypothetical protein L6164_001250 [Bauhinia variegata]|uniref:Uncharacterized protein n=1 Tax=Bauhinia variegata TaxID=167791 RepID=A0ACB9QFK6_BAUVA|nr:hypothetical protein L6164_001250 [Bauhinia variegata]
MDIYGWCVAIATKPRGHVQVGDAKDEAPYQANEISHVLPIIEVEPLYDLVDETLEDYECVVDIVRETIVHDGQSDDEERNFL